MIGAFNSDKAIAVDNKIMFAFTVLDSNYFINDFKVKFIMPIYINVYDKLKLNGDATNASYFSKLDVENVNTKEISFYYKRPIKKLARALNYFHVVPILNGIDSIKAEYSGIDNNGNTVNGTIYSGKIISVAPPIEKLIALKENNQKYRLKAKLKYKHDYVGYVPEGANYNFTFKSTDGKEYKVNSSSINVVNGQRAEYNVTGEISYGGTTWNNINQTIELDGYPSDVVVVASKTKEAETTAKDAVKFIFTNDFFVGFSLSKGIFQDYMLGLNLFKVNLVDSLLTLIPSKVTLYHSFNKKNTSLALGQELLISLPWINKLKFSLGIEENVLLFPFNRHESNTSLNFGMYYRINEDYSLQLTYKKHNQRVINSNIFLSISKTF